jgi:glycine/D-amino acid oxidase-like deaminating enzyme
MKGKVSDIDYLIIGQGIAGTLLAHELIKANKRILVIDENKESTSSKIAAGMFTPISGKRMSKTPDAEMLIETALSCYSELEIVLGCKLLHRQPVYQLFGSVKEQNDLGSRMDDQGFSKYINLYPLREPNLKTPFGAFEIEGTGWVHTRLLIDRFAVFLLHKQYLLLEKFEHGLLHRKDGLWHYKNVSAQKIIFCEGYRNIHNPYFRELEFALCKGEVLTIECAGLCEDKIIKKGIYLVHLGNKRYKAGATYEWDDLSEDTTEQGRSFLRNKLDELLEAPYEVIKHEASVRPCTNDRKAILGEHPHHRQMYIFNGLGTKGVLQGPALAGQMAEHLVYQKAIHKEVHIARLLS